VSYSGVSQDEVRKVIDAIKSSERDPHVSYTPGLWGNEYIGLDGEFTVEQLEALAKLMRDAQR